MFGEAYSLGASKQNVEAFFEGRLRKQMQKPLPPELAKELPTSACKSTNRKITSVRRRGQAIAWFLNDEPLSFKNQDPLADLIGCGRRQAARNDNALAGDMSGKPPQFSVGLRTCKHKCERTPSSL